MIFTQEQIQDNDGILNGWGNKSSIGDWESSLPTLSTIEFFKTDPNYDVYDINSGSKAIQELGTRSVIGALRNSITQISTSWGYFSSSFGSLKGIFKDTLEFASRVSAGLDALVSGIGLAIDSISWVPVVGWILAVIKMVAKVIGKIVRAIREKGEGRAQAELDLISKSYALPTAKWTPEADTIMCRELQRRLMDGAFDLDWAFAPRYPAEKVQDFVAERQKLRPDDPCYSGWLVYSNRKPTGNDDAEYMPGLGCVPGTHNLHGTMSLVSALRVVDYGDFFPITRMTAFQIWEQAVKGDSGLAFAIDTDGLISKWKRYVAAAYNYGRYEIGGWSRINGRIDRDTPLTVGDIEGLRYNCSGCDTAEPTCDNKLAKKKSSKRWRTPVYSERNLNHSKAFTDHLKKIFGWKTSHAGKPLKEDDWWDTMTPVAALRNMHERQEAMIRSPKCMYLDDNVDANGSGQARFKAIKRGSDLHKIWTQSVTAMFESGDWKRIDYRDVIPGEDVDSAIRLLLSNDGTTPEKFFNLDSPARPGMAARGFAPTKGPSILGDPKPPDPPGTVQVTTALDMGAVKRARNQGSGNRSSRKKSSAAPLLIGVAAVGLLMMRGKK